MSLFDDGRTRALKAQLKALDAPRYRASVQTPADRVQVAVLSAADLLGQERWLRGQNEAGAQVRLRPAEPSGLVLVGPLSGRQRAALEEDGFPGALVTSLGADRYEVWVCLAGGPLPRGLEEAMGQALNAHYTDGGASGASLAGALAAGLEDPRNPWTRSADGQGVYVTVTAHSRIIAPAATALRDELLEHMRLPEGYFSPRGHDRPDHGDGQDHDRSDRADRADRGWLGQLEHPGDGVQGELTFAHHAQRLECADPGEQDHGDDGWAATTAATAARSRMAAELGEQVNPPQRGIAGGANEAMPTQAPEQDETLAEQFAALREQILSRNRKGLDARQAEFAAAHQLSRAHPDLTVAELRPCSGPGWGDGPGHGWPARRPEHLYSAHRRAGAGSATTLTNHGRGARHGGRAMKRRAALQAAEGTEPSLREARQDKGPDPTGTTPLFPEAVRVPHRSTERRPGPAPVLAPPRSITARTRGER